MKVICVMVSSLDGKITKGNSPNIHQWTSKEDQKYFHQLVETHSLIVMGRKTYEVSNVKPQAGKLRIVITSNPSKYQGILSQLEFTNEDPKTLVKRLANQYSTMLLVGGGGLNTAFFKAHLVTELWLTFEPRILGKGRMFVEEEDLDTKLELLTSEKINEQGTILLKYKVIPQ